MATKKVIAIHFRRLVKLFLRLEKRKTTFNTMAAPGIRPMLKPMTSTYDVDPTSPVKEDGYWPIQFGLSMVPTFMHTLKATLSH